MLSFKYDYLNLSHFSTKESKNECQLTISINCHTDKFKALVCNFYYNTWTKCPNQQYLNTYPHSSATLHNKYTCYVIICMNSKTAKCLETYMKLFHIMVVVVVVRINKSDNDHNRVTGTIPKSYQKISEQHGWKPHHDGTTENSHIGYHTHTLGSTGVQYLYHEK